MVRFGVDGLPSDVSSWLADAEVLEVILRADGAAWVRDREGTRRRAPRWGPKDVGAVLAELAAAGERGPVALPPSGLRVDVTTVRRAGTRVVRLEPRREETVDLAGLQREGLVLPEVRASIEEAIRSRRTILVASPSVRRGGSLFESVVGAWRERGWLHRLRPGAGAPEVRSARALGADVVVVEFLERRAWPELWLGAGPALVRVQAPSAGRALRLVAAWTAAAGMPLDVARELVVAHVDLVIEEECDGRARGTWRVRPDEVPTVEFIAGTKSRLTPSSPPEASDGSAPETPPRRRDPHNQVAPRAWARRRVPREGGEDERAARPLEDALPSRTPWPSPADDEETPDLLGEGEADQMTPVHGRPSPLPDSGDEAASPEAPGPDDRDR